MLSFNVKKYFTRCLSHNKMQFPLQFQFQVVKNPFFYRRVFYHCPYYYYKCIKTSSSSSPKRNSQIFRSVIENKIAQFNYRGKHLQLLFYHYKKQTMKALSAISTIFLFAVFTFSIVYLLYSRNKTEIKSFIDNQIKRMFVNKVIRNRSVVNKIANEIMLLCKEDKAQRLVRNILIKEVFGSSELKERLFKVSKREILEYLKSEECKKEFIKLVKEEIMRNEILRNDLYRLIKEYITKEEILSLEDTLETILVDVLNIQAIHDHISKKVEAEVHNLLRDEEMIQYSIHLLRESVRT